MGQTIWVDVGGRKEGEGLPDNSIMMRLKDPLDDLSTKLHVAKISEFFDYSVIAQEFGASVPAKWFEPGKALTAVSALREHLTAHPEDLDFQPKRSTQHWPEKLMAELEHCEETLRKAAEQEKKFRFLIVG